MVISCAFRITVVSHFMRFLVFLLFACLLKSLAVEYPTTTPELGMAKTLLELLVRRVQEIPQRM